MQEEEVTVVPIDGYSFEVLDKEKYYAFAKKTRKAHPYFAFYVGKPTSGIIGYGKVKEVEEGGRELVPGKYWLMNLASKNPPYIKVTFNKIIKLKKPITSGKKLKTIQGTVYSTLKKLTTAENFDQLK